MTDNALIVSENGGALAMYQTREEVRELGDRLMAMHPAASEVGTNAMRAAAQLALMLGANPLPGVNEMHIWRDEKGRNCMSLGIGYWRRKAEEWGGVLYEMRPRVMRPDEATEYGVPQGVTAAICKGVRAEDMIRYRGLGFATNEVWDMCGRTGVGTSNANEYAKKGRPSTWTALKRAETDLLRQLFPAQFAQVDRQMMTNDAPVIISPLGDVVDGDTTERQPYTLSDANRDLFGDGATQPAPAEDGDWQEAQPADPGPLPDDEQAISESNGDFANVAAACLGTDALTIKRRMGELKLSAPRNGRQRIEVYRALKADMGAADDLMGDVAGQPPLVTVDATQPGREYQD